MQLLPGEATNGSVFYMDVLEENIQEISGNGRFYQKLGETSPSEIQKSTAKSTENQ